MIQSATISELRLAKVVPCFTFRSAIDKQPVAHCQVASEGMVGDEQAESFHGGQDRALLQFETKHYSALAAHFPDAAQRFVPGSFGENLVVTGMSEATMCIGDKVHAGSAVLEVAQPRLPCFKLNYQFGEPELSRYVQDHGMGGWFYRVLEGGLITSGDPIAVIERPYPQWTLARVQHYLNIELQNHELMAQLLLLKPLAEQIKKVFRRRLATGLTEDWSGRLSDGNPNLNIYERTSVSDGAKN